MCDALGVERVSVVGNSMGGFIGGELALSFATRVDRLVLVVGRRALDRGAAGAGRCWRSRGSSRRGRPPRERFEIVGRAPAAAAPGGDAVGDPLPGEALGAARRRSWCSASASRASWTALRAIFDYAYRERLPEIEIPVLIVWGSNDLLVPVGDAYRYAGLIGANARVEIFEDTGHAPMLERPSRFNDLLRGFLAGEPAPEAGVAGVSTDA